MRKNILAGFILLISLSAGIQAQGLDQDCNPLPEPPECRQFVATIAALDSRIARLQQRLRDASPATKPGLLRSIDQLNSERSDAAADLARCRREHGAATRVLAPNELTARFTGTATVRTTDSNAAGPFEVDLDVVLQFTRNRCRVTITSFPTLNLKTKDLPVIGRINVAVTRTGGGAGTFHPVSGAMNMSITLHFHYDTVLLGDDDATFDLTTGNSVSGDRRYNVTGSPLTEGGSITLVGTTRFRNGYLEGRSGSLVITANISPRP
jgi:hypothetical protein